MIRKIGLFQNLLEKYKIEKPVSADAQKYIFAARSETIKSVLSAYGEFGIGYKMLVSFNILTRRIGIRTSIAWSRFILAGIALTMAGIIAAGAYLSLKHFQKHMDRDRLPFIQGEQIAGAGKNDKPDAKGDTFKGNSPGNESSYRLGVERFSGVEEKTVNDITDKIISGITDLLGKNPVIDLRGARDKNVKMIVMGSSRSLAGRIIITAKLVDVETGRILLTEQETVDSPAETGPACSKISKKIVDRLE